MEEEKKHDHEEGCDGGVCKIPPRPSDMQKKLEDAVNQSLRALADYQNLQRETAKERETMAQYATLRVVERFLPVFDNFNTAMSHMPKSDDKAVVNWAVGVGFIQKQLEDVLMNVGLMPIKTEGQTFDATKHEAVGEETPDVAAGLAPAPGTILKEVQVGYEIAGKTVRPSKVIIAK